MGRERLWFLRNEAVELCRSNFGASGRRKVLMGVNHPETMPNRKDHSLQERRCLLEGLQDHLPQRYGANGQWRWWCRSWHCHFRRVWWASGYYGLVHILERKETKAIWVHHNAKRKLRNSRREWSWSGCRECGLPGTSSRIQLQSPQDQARGQWLLIQAVMASPWKHSRSNWWSKHANHQDPSQ